MQNESHQMVALVSELRSHLLSFEQEHLHEIETISARYRASARNLLHYLALRQIDLRDLQAALASLGLSSLGRLESHTLSTIDSVLVALHRLAGSRWSPPESAPVDYMQGQVLLNLHTQRLFGTPAGKRTVRIMVTIPSEAANKPELVYDLLASGMDVMRINCAHDSPETWLKMIDNLRRAEKRLGRRCKIYGDLAGPKLRTGSINQAGSVVKVRPKRNFRGEVTMPASVLFIPAGYALSLSSLPSADACIPVNGDLLQQALIGDSIELVDARGSRRTLQIVSIYGPLCCAESFKTVYFESQVSLRRLRDGQEQASGTIGKLPETILPIRLVRGDKLILTCQQMPGRDVVYDDKQEVMLPAQISCTLPEAFTFVQADERIWLDDGKIGGHVIANDGRYITVEITHADPRGSRLLPEKGINLPDTDLHMPALTDKDIEDLAFLAQHADLVGLSFLHSARDVAELQEHLQRLGGRQLGVVLKIENAGAFANLPRILLAGLHAPPVGIMVARGDLAVELGFERLSEVQEEILWLCEAAHVPVIWATQVLETMTKTGAPSRAEISDAVMSGRAECVMLNKGPYIVDTLRLLNGVLERMESHQSKKRTMLRRLSVSNLE